MPEDKSPLKHIAIIMDGNGRWAKQQGKNRFYGHRAGHTAVLKTVRYCVKLGLESLTLYAFSSENWSRPASEVSALMLLFSQAMKRNRKLFIKYQIKFNVIGDVSRFSSKLQSEIKALQDETKAFSAMTLNIAANYGGKWDIIHATKLLAKQVQSGIIDIDEINEEKINQALSLHDQAPVDLLIRTGGELRISNFLLWQAAYAEFYFTPIFWPQFDELALDKAIMTYQQRTRRFGGVLEND